MLLEKICEELGVEIGEEWEDHQTEEKYKISLIGLEKFRECDETWVLATAYDHGKLMRGNLKPEWKPKVGESYCIPYIYSKDVEGRQLRYNWEESCMADKFLWDNNLVFKTKEEAIKAANKMLKALKE